MNEQDILAAHNVDYWMKLHALRLRPSVIADYTGYEYLNGLLEFRSNDMCVKKGTQVGLTTRMFTYLIWLCIHENVKVRGKWEKLRQGIIYGMPTEDTVQDLARSAFNPIIQSNPIIKQYVSSDTNTHKMINGHSALFIGTQLVNFNGADEVRKLRSFGADFVFLDEIDHIPLPAREQSLQRLNASKLAIRCMWGSPTTPGYGIDELYTNGNQHKYQIKCRSCGKYTCIEDDFPNCIIEVDGRWIRSCKHCQSEIFVSDGSHQPDYKDKDLPDSFWISSLLHPYCALDDKMKRFYECDERTMPEFMRSVLGIATAESACEISTNDVLQNVHKTDGMLFRSDGETYMGADVGKGSLHYVIGYRTAKDRFKIIRLGKAGSFEELRRIGEEMNVRTCVIDAAPDYNSSIEFQRSAPYRVYRCTYNQTTTKFNDKENTISANRNEWCDRVHQLFTGDGTIELPRLTNEVNDYAFQLTQMHKTYVDDRTGSQKPMWIKKKGGQTEDHFFHTTIYFLLACRHAVPRGALQKNKSLYTKTKSRFTI